MDSSATCMYYTEYCCTLLVLENGNKNASIPAEKQKHFFCCHSSHYIRTSIFLFGFPSLDVRQNADPGWLGRLVSLLPSTVRAFGFVACKTRALSSLSSTRIELRPTTHAARRSQQLVSLNLFFLYLETQQSDPRRDSTPKTNPFNSSRIRGYSRPRFKDARLKSTPRYKDDIFYRTMVARR